MKKPEFEFYRRLNGHVEFQEFMDQLSKKDRSQLLGVIYRVQTAGLLTSQQMQWIKKLDQNLYELRSQSGNNIQRGLYFHVEDNHYIITHGFTKKTQKTPQREITHSKQLRAEYYERGNSDDQR